MEHLSNEGLAAVPVPLAEALDDLVVGDQVVSAFEVLASVPEGTASTDDSRLSSAPTDRQGPGSADDI